MIPGDGHRQAFEAASPAANTSSSALLEIDAFLTRSDKGTALVRGPKSARDVVLDFVAARLAARGRIVVATRSATALLSECARVLGIEPQEERSDLGRILARVLRERRVALVTPIPASDTHEATVIHRLVAEAGPLVVFYADESTLVTGEFDAEIDVPETLCDADRALWFQAYAAGLPVARSWASLASWGARAAAVDASRVALSNEARAALSALVRLHRPLALPLARAAFGEALGELVREGYCVAQDVVQTTALASGFASADEGAVEGAALSLASELASTDDSDWLETAARAFASANEWNRADVAMLRARTLAWDEEARAAIDRRWFEHVRALPLDAERLLAEARVALADGNNDLACAWADLASARSLALVDGPAQAAISIEAELLLARAKTVSGDARGAEAILSRLGERDLDDATRGTVSADLAEARYLLGDMSGARSQATHAENGPPSSQLDARNTLGKVLLAESAFDQAEAHFLRDEITAREGGLEAPMWRARVNRAVALLSRGEVQLAERILEDVARQGRSKNDARLLAFAVDNLAVCAMKKREYARATALLDEAVTLRMRLGERAKAARLVGNLAELRLRLGLVEHAEHALAFGARLVAQAQLPARRGQLALVAARVSLARGRVDEARAKIEQAKRELRIAGEKEYQTEARVVEARVAYEEGRVEAMHRSLDAIDERGVESEVCAEIVLLRALATRAEGQPCTHLLVRALDLAEAAQADETAIEAHGLVAEVRAAEGDLRSANEHRRFAVSLRDRVASELPGDIARAYRGRRDFAWMEDRETVRPSSDDVPPNGPNTVRSRSGLMLAAPPQEFADDSSPAVSAPTMPSLLAAPPARETVRSKSDVAPRSSRGVSAGLVSPSASGLVRSGPVSPSAPLRSGLVSPSAPLRSGPVMVGDHPKMRALLAAVAKVARAPGTVLVQGESGTGKELVATAIHQWSPRADGPCITVNCAALAEPLLLSELFGHEKGAFTGAVARHRGRFELAEGGTLFLDEIGDISPRTQVSLLRVLQEKTFERVGGTAQLRANVRIVCATHKNLRAMVERGEFREDLYYRLAEITVEVPALRDRISDLPALAEAVLERVAQEHKCAGAELAPDALALLARYPFPGNVRELENILRSVSLLEDTPIIRAAELLQHHPALRAACEARRDSTRAISVASSHSSPAAATGVAFETVRSGEVSLPTLKRQIERECIGRALAETGGNITKAAELLGMKRPRLSQLVKQYELGAEDALTEDS